MKYNWKKCKISDLGAVVGGSTPSTKDKSNYGGNISWITPKDLSIFNERFIYNGGRNITEKGLKSCSTQLMPKNSVLFSSRAPIGYVAIAGKEMCTNQGFKNVIPNESTDYLFLYYLLKFNKNNIENMASGTTFKEVSGATMKNIEVIVPESKQEQQKIAKILSSLDNKIELNNAINNNLEQMAMTLFDNKFKNINDGNKCIGDYIKPKRGKNLLSKDAINGDVPVVAGGLTPATYHNVANTEAPVITISASGANAGYVNLWHIPVWSSDSSFIDFNMTESVYFWYVLLKKRQQQLFDSQMGSAQPHVYPKHIEIMPIDNLNIDVIIDYNDNITPLFKTIGANIQENNKLSQLRDTLLPKLMSGEIDVSKVDISSNKLSFNKK